MKDTEVEVSKVNFDKEIKMITNSPDDPRTTKRWGYITALPSEYLIHFTKGRLNEKSSGQGASCFKYPRDTIFIIPTSMKEIVFKANQLTSDNVDIQVRGMIVYKINDPLKIFKLINFSNRPMAEEKLGHMIADMCRSYVKELVAIQTVEDCMRKRTEGIAEALKQSISQVVSSDNSGWGVEIVTVNVQDIFIQDKEIFQAMQMLYKSDKIRESKLAEIKTEKELQIRRLSNEKDLGEHRKVTELEKQKIEAELTESKIALTRKNEEKQFQLDRFRVEEQESLNTFKQNKDLERQKQLTEFETESMKKQTESSAILHKEELEYLQKRFDIESKATPFSLEREYIEKALPQIASTLSQHVGDVKYNIIQGDGKEGNLFQLILSQAMEIFQNRNSEKNASQMKNEK
jgi:flotillin